jgi:fibro-slime domain-containing protein
VRHESEVFMRSFFLHHPTTAILRRSIRRAAAASVTLAAAALVGACGGGSENSQGSAGSGGSAGDGGGNLFGGGGAGTNVSVPPDSAFIPADIGSYALGNAIEGQGVGDTGLAGGEDGCNVLVGVVRDFRGIDEPNGHPDFQSFSGQDATTGLVGDTLGSDAKPVYSSQCEAGSADDCPFGPQTTTEERYDEWYRFTEGTNKPFLIYFKFEPNGDISTFESTRFFPLDGAGWGNSGMDTDDVPRNFHFTTELHTKFKYQGGETFRFSGDDDLWVFINQKLALDLGGLHPSVTGEIDLDQRADELGIEIGNVYSLELFHAERHTSESNFRVDTNLAFVDCGEVLPDPK